MTMIPVFLSILIGIAVGYLIRHQRIVGYTSQLLNVVIMLLLFVLGIAVGSNKQLITSFSSKGFEALLLTIGGTLGSLIAARLLHKYIFHRFGSSSSREQSANNEEE